MKRLFALGVLALCLQSSVTLAALKVSRGSLGLTLPTKLHGLLIMDSFKNITIVPTTTPGAIVLTATLVAENDKKLAAFMSNWELKGLGQNFARISVWAKSFNASYMCDSTMTNDVYSRLKGVCLENLVIQVPVTMLPNLSSDKKIVALNVEATEEISNSIPSESIDALMSELKKATFDSDRMRVLEGFASAQLAENHNHVQNDDLIKLMKSLSFDDARLDALAALLPFISDRLGTYELMLKLLSFSSGQAEAITLLFE